jgi:hypothetical protein
LLQLAERVDVSFLELTERIHALPIEPIGSSSSTKEAPS